MDCRDFHDQLVSPKSKIGRLLRGYVCVRIEDMAGVDIGLFDFDPDSTLYCFILNANEQIYLRYGGRDDDSADGNLSDDTLEHALKRGLELHKRSLEGDLDAPDRPAAKYPRDYPEVRNGPIAKKQCVHCHHLGSGKTRLLQSQGKFDRKKDPWVYPDVRRLGIELDKRHGLSISKVEGAAKDAGIRKKDEIVKLEGTEVHSFGDLQYRLDLHPHDSETLTLSVMRDGKQVEATVKLDKLWRVTAIERRSSTHAIEPFPEFWGKPVDDSARRKLGIDKGHFALEVTRFWVKTNAQSAGLKVGDVVYSVDGVTESEYTVNPILWIRLNRKPDDKITVKVLRAGKRLEFTFKLKARPW